MTSCILVTGGCGGLGLLVAEHLARKGPVNLILTGLSALDAPKEQRLTFLKQLGARVLYIRADVCDVQAMKQSLAQARQVYGPIHGVIHAAGLAGVKPLFDKFLMKCSPQILWNMFAIFPRFQPFLEILVRVTMRLPIVF